MVVGVTGSTGQLGRLVARHLSEAGIEQRLLVRRADQAPTLAGATVVSAGTYGDRSAAVAALRGIEALFMVSAAESPDRLEQHRTFVRAAMAAGVRHMVYTSFMGAAPEATFTLARDHWATEEAIRSSGMRYTCLRNNLYLDILPHFAGADGVIRGPAGTGRVGAVARADIARVASSVLRDPEGHANAVYELTGPEALSFNEIANAITDVTGRPTRFHDETVDEAYASRAHYNAEPWQLDAWVSTYSAVKKGEMAKVTTTVESITGRTPLTLRQFLATT